jgi:hypothetical protein
MYEKQRLIQDKHILFKSKHFHKNLVYDNENIILFWNHVKIFHPPPQKKG